MLCHPAGRHIWKWFLELGRTRSKHTTVISSMVGSQVIHELAPITWVEKAAWSAVTGRVLNQFEIRCLEHMDSIYVAAMNNGKQRARSGQSVGEYCQNKSVEKCRAKFGAGLEEICSTCPD